jgi:hypothetical protein
MKRVLRLAAIAVMASCVATRASATDYLFHIACPDREFVAKWSTGDIDPGREYLRVATGTHYPNCSITDYDPVRDAGLPMDTYSHEGGVIAGIPLVGSIICGIFGC